jgi:CRISPR-associated protein Cas1
MIKRTLYFGNPAYLSCKNDQLVIGIPNAHGYDKMLGNTVPIEDIGIVVLDHQQITVTQHLITKLTDNNVALVNCDEKHLPTGLLLNLSGHTLQQVRFKAQLEASVPLKKQLWQQTIKYKIANQAAVLNKIGVETQNMNHWASNVKSGDGEYHEARAAAYYWSKLFEDEILEFRRDREGKQPNGLLNYGYSILRAVVARGLVSSGLLPTLGIFHRNQYNAYCLADDIMEPYRPYVDEVVLRMVKSGQDYTALTTEHKRQLLSIPTLDVVIDGKRSPLMVGLQRTTASLVDCFEGTGRKILYPEMA